MNQNEAVIRTAPAAQLPAAGADKSHDRKFRFLTLPFLALLLPAVWLSYHGEYYAAGDDFGYYLGVTGGVMMLVLLLYSLRKHIRFMRHWGATRYWFRLHMILGIAGPTLILFHSTFRAGSLNATVALACMILVAGSGVVGRIIYRKIHHGLYGRSLTLQEVQSNLGIVGGDVKSKFHFAPQIEKCLKQFETSALSETGNVWRRFLLFMFVGLQARWAFYVVSRELERIGKLHARKHAWDIHKLEIRLSGGKQAIRKYLDAVIEVARFSAYERLFSLWHILHIPFVFMLIISGVVHVIAVHMY